MTDLWIEKYRPHSLSEVYGQETVVERMKGFLKKGFPHMIFAGPAGCGKTSAALALAHDMFGESWRGNLLEQNASDERGIDVIRNKVKDFARTKPLGVSYRLILLDEADALTADAQHALRRTMEKYSETARFILIANYSNKLIDPIQSRCAIFRFRPLDREKAKQYLVSVLEKEGIKASAGAIEAVLDIAEGDMRRALNILQSCSATSDSIEEKTVYETVAAAEPGRVKAMLALALKGEFIGARTVLLELLGEGIAGEDIMREAARQLYSVQVEEPKRAAAIEKAGEFEWRLASGGNPQIQIEAFLAFLSAQK